jgi:cyclophilin family peptidyl-prolyl cis-trans isomerase
MLAKGRSLWQDAPSSQSDAENTREANMRRILMAAAMSAALTGAGRAQDSNAVSEAKAPAPAPAGNPAIVIETSMGTIKAELWPDKAPATVQNFMAYVDGKSYDGTIFHRVIDGFMIQGGGFTAAMEEKPTKAPVKNEAKSDVRNDRGTLAMARTMVVDSATAQFFINLKDNGFLNHQNETPRGFGYCVFGKVTDGMDVVDKIAKVATTSVGPFDDVPAKAVTIVSIRRAQ